MDINAIVSKFLKSDLMGKSLKVLAIKVTGVLLLFLLSLFLTNYYSPRTVGQYDFVRSILMIIGGLSILGTNQSIIYYSGHFKSQNTLGSLKNVYFKMLAIIVLASCVMLFLKLIIPDKIINNLFSKDEASYLIDKVVYSIALYAITFLNIDMLRAMGKTILSELFRNIFRYTPFFILAIYLAYTSNEVYLIDAYLLSFSCLAIASFIIIYLNIKKTEFQTQTSELTYKHVFLKSYPMAISALSYFLMQSVDILLLAKYSTFEEVAYYAVAVKLATIASLALLSVNIIIAPKIAEMYSNNDYNALKTLLKNSNRLILALSFPAIAFIAILSEWILGLFGNKYVLAQIPLLIILFGQLFNSLCGPVGIYMNMTGKQNKLQRMLIFGLLINVVLNIIFIPKYGMIGAASSTAFSMILWKSMAAIISYKNDKVKTFIS
ncbi:MATE family efflux transporter [Winogradskyella costae]|uniref:MATE family efflux transporter n=1 Tax=Winogradskyella costae TaxID=2697008 RepID=UPI0015CC9688|nr:MATE family efflux transporter [Winogradskyella costae]